MGRTEADLIVNKRLSVDCYVITIRKKDIPWQNVEFWKRTIIDHQMFRLL